MNKLHQPVLVKEIVDYLNIKNNQWYIDATFGRGGHTALMLKKQAKIIAFDFDHEAIAYGKEVFKDEIKQNRLILIRDNFTQIARCVKEINQDIQIYGILFDFGTTTDQLKSIKRGFSFEDSNHELDMRMDQRLTIKAKDLLAVAPTKQLSKIFYHYGGEKQAKRIAKAIVKARKNGNLITTTGELSNLILKIKKSNNSKIHPATKVFQALRIVVNDELNNIEIALNQIPNLAIDGTRIATIAFHEGEDRIVKNIFKQWEKEKIGKSLTKKPIKPSDQEFQNNPKSRSAKLRIFKYEKNKP